MELRHGGPWMSPYAVDRDARRRKCRICEGADGDGDHVGHRVVLEVDGRAAGRAEPECGAPAFVSDEHILVGATFDLDLVPRKARLHAEHAAGAPLTGE